MWKQKKRKELWLLALATLCITVLGTLQSLNTRLPNPLSWLAAILGPYPKAIYSLFQ
ncbi:hypothetical protein [Paenibacillus plantarum]|uniref:hypothetical protein n=1 Tax=Paenibacillus plantarum TaxID=2654975 RepID=UPI00149121C9|nr:hypothetical protein [Paenibacillus plantarum]